MHLSPGGGAGNYIVVPGGVAATGNGWAGIFTANVTGAGGVLSYGGSNNSAGLFYGNTSGNGQYGIAAQGTSWAGYFMGPVVITSGYLQFPDGTQQTTASSHPFGSFYIKYCSGGCYNANPYTGGCSCPSYTPNVTGWVMSSVAPAVCQYMCY